MPKDETGFVPILKDENAGLAPGPLPGRSQKGKRAGQVLGIAGTRFILFPLSMVVGILVTRQLGPDNRGAFAFVSLVTAFVGPLFQLGFPSAIRYAVAAGEAKPRDTVVTAFVVSFVLGGVGAVIVALAFLGNLLGESARMLSWLQLGPVLVLLPILAASMALSCVLIGDSRFEITNAIEIAREVVMVLLLLGCVVVGGAGLSGAIWALVLSQGLSACACWVAVVLLFRPVWYFDLRLARRSLAYGVKIWVGSLATRSNDRLDQLLLAFTSSPGQLGLYSVAVRVAELPLMLGTFLVPVFFNRIAAGRSIEERAAITGRLHRLLFWAVTGCVLLLAAVGHILVPGLYGQAFAPAALILLIYLPGVVASATQQALGTFFAAAGRPMAASTIQMWGLAVGLVALPVLVPRLGATGAALGSTLAYLGAAIAALVLYRRLVWPLPLRLFQLDPADLRWGVSTLAEGFSHLAARLPFSAVRRRGEEHR